METVAISIILLVLSVLFTLAYGIIGHLIIRPLIEYLLGDNIDNLVKKSKNKFVVIFLCILIGPFEALFVFDDAIDDFIDYVDEILTGGILIRFIKSKLFYDE